MSEARAAGALTPGPGLAAAIREGSGVDVNQCYQCGKCAAGCPIAYAMDYPPAQLIHAARLGLDDVVLGSRTIWLCAACETCTTRCPQEVDIARVMDAAKILAVKRGVKPAVADVRAFHKAALGSIQRFGRMWEAGMILSLNLRTGEFVEVKTTTNKEGEDVKVDLKWPDVQYALKGTSSPTLAIIGFDSLESLYGPGVLDGLMEFLTSLLNNDGIFVATVTPSVKSTSRLSDLAHTHLRIDKISGVTMVRGEEPYTAPNAMTDPESGDFRPKLVPIL